MMPAGNVSISQNPTNQFHQLHIELYDEIIAFLWNDFPSLKACSLASRVLLAPSQKRLFYSIALNAHAGFLNASSGHESIGTPSSFYWLLARSPHLADYIQALHIRDEYDHDGALDVESLDATPPVLGNEHDLHFENYKFINGKEISELDHTIQPNTDGQTVGGWLLRDKFLPLFAPLLSNLRALHISLGYSYNLHHLTYRVLFTLLSLMRLPSLIHLRLRCRIYPQAIINIGANIKHLALDYAPRDVNIPFQLEHPPVQPVYLESFLVCSPFVFLGRFPPTSRIQFSRLRKLVVTAHSADDYAPTQELLRQCCDTLEDFEFTPFLANTSTSTSGLEMTDTITLNGLTSLKRLAVKLLISNNNEDFRISTPFLWLCNLLRSGYSASVTQHLEELSIRAFCRPGTWGNIPIPWKPFFEALLEDELKNLRVLNIFITNPARRYSRLILEKLNGCEGMAKLRCLPGLILNVRVCDQPFHFEQDIRWETHDWTKWTDVN